MKNQRKYLTLNEVEKLKLASRQGRWPERDECLIQMGFTHGLRVSELCNLRLADVDMQAGVVYIRRLKNGLSTIQPLVPEEKVLIGRWIASRKSRPYAWSDYLFISVKSERLCRQQVGRLLKAYGAMAGIGVRPHPHMLRHSCGYELANQGADTRLIQDYLGHRNIRHTVIYTASNPARFSGLWRNS